MIYPLCHQTVTVYRLRDGQVERCVLEGCSYTWQEAEIEDELGYRRETRFLLILPGAEQRIFLGDRILSGIGPEVAAELWPEFVPVTVPTLAEAAYVKPVWLEGRIVHWEAGRN